MPSNLHQKPQLRRWLGLSPALLTISVFMLVPLLLLATYSFKPADPYGGVETGFSLEAWTQLFFDRDLDDTLVFDPVYLHIIARTVMMALLGTLLSLLVGFPVAWYIVQQRPAVRDILVLLVTIPFWTNLLVRAYAWILILGKKRHNRTAVVGLGRDRRIAGVDVQQLRHWRWFGIQLHPVDDSADIRQPGKTRF